MTRPVTKFQVSEHHRALAGAPTVQPVPVSQGRTAAPLHNPLLAGRPKRCLSGGKQERTSFQVVSTLQQTLDLLSSVERYVAMSLLQVRLIFNLGYSVSDSLLQRLKLTLPLARNQYHVHLLAMNYG